jgi:hypothetical protein
VWDHPAQWIWVLIPLAAISLAPFKMWLRVKEKQISAQSDLAAEKSAQYAQHMERVEARLRVLEQIVTDGGAQTAAQIEALREFVIAVLFMVFAFTIIRHKLGVPVRSMREMRGEPPVSDAENERLRHQVQQLQDRIRVLERIVTDRGAETAAQIEALRERDALEDGDQIR